MRYILNFLIVIIVSACMVSCQDDFLDKKPLDRMTEADVWNDATLIEAYVVSKYRALNNGFSQEAWLSSCTDESYIYSDRGQLSYTRGTITPDNPGYRNGWGSNYRYIRLCNIFFEKIDDAPISDQLKRQYTGEMKFIRAYCYSSLVKQFGGVPIIKKSFNAGDDLIVTRDSYDECVDFIVEDLDDAASILKDFPMTGSDIGRATQGAALALKSRVLLYAASLLSNPNADRNKWQKAADAAKAVIDLGEYSLVDEYSDIWNVKRNSEIIMDRAFLARLFEQQIDLENTPNSYGGWGGNFPSLNLVENYETIKGILPKDDPDFDSNNPYSDRDPRLTASILVSGSMWKGSAVEPWLPGGKDSRDGINPWCATVTGFYMKKFMQESVIANYNSVTGDQHWIYFRLGEIYLNYAEAMFHVGDENVTREYLNKIRKRKSVNMPDINDTGDALYKRIQRERMVELAFEEHRFYDVRRWKIAMDTENEPFRGVEITKNNDESFTFTEIVVESKLFLEQHYWHPIPRSEIEKNDKLVQNPGYYN